MMNNKTSVGGAIRGDSCQNGVGLHNTHGLSVLSRASLCHWYCDWCSCIESTCRGDPDRGDRASLCGETTSADIEGSKTGRESYTARRMSEIVIAHAAERCRAASSSNVDQYIFSPCQAQSAL